MHPREWPHGSLRAADLRASGWRPVPFREFVLKIRQPCDLACTYCYVYSMADQSWRTKPVRMSESVVVAAARRVAEHADAHALPRISIALHGGEPLLAPVAEIAELVTVFRRAVSPEVDVAVSVQTNGVRLTGDMLSALSRHGVRVGVSVDGGADIHDRRRADRQRRGSFARVSENLRVLGSRAFRPIFGGLLCVVDVRSDPDEVWDALLAFDPPSVNFLLPHANWSTSPRADVDPTAYGRWLAEAFDRWFAIRPHVVRVRLFEDLIHLLFGGVSTTELIGLSPSAVAVVESDGSIEQSDSLKSAYPEAPSTGLSVLRDSFDDALEHPGMMARQLGPAALCEQCRSCRVMRVCGGGLYAHRYRRGTGFLNPSRYCADLMYLVDHVRARVVTALDVPA
ncbi:hypothetical protein Val02_65280 [Virgisporangium aliadipatigenens]|uniref:Radical SAM core domain-containing protein n=1 Tax=Virgisporangium aliadipatigenens TaxID=741659 RepID=A0A8J3YSF8_9ACTN|nr:FxsB family cyclophane-forming radical SAM/SPASM peptide maturase [Virgisporangium aliadipatigenens]GIJ49642.1 hypothetical protein Val02_65280 [Virgisporangium aliadipatigenens]